MEKNIGLGQSNNWFLLTILLHFHLKKRDVSLGTLCRPEESLPEKQLGHQQVGGVGSFWSRWWCFVVGSVVMVYYMLRKLFKPHAE